MPKQATTALTLTALLQANDLAGYTITRYGYGQARVVGNDVIEGPLNYGSGDSINRLHHLLADTVGDRADNNETYEVVTLDGQKLCLWFHDWRLYVGTAIRTY